MKRTNDSLFLRWALAPLLLLAACGPAPTITGFSASPDRIPYGDTARLSWNVNEADSVEISGVGTVAKDQTTADVQPTQTTTYTLTAKNFWGKSTAPITVTLIPKFQMKGGTYNTGSSVGTTVAALLRDPAGAPPAADTVVTITPPSGSPFTVSCQAGKGLCLATLPGQTPLAGTYQARATLNGTQLTTSFTVTPRTKLSQAAPIAVSKAGSQSLQASWAPVFGAVSYRVHALDWSNPTEPFGPAVVVSSTTAAVSTFAAMSSTGDYGVVVEASVVDLSQTTAPAQLLDPNTSRSAAHLGGRVDGWQYFDSPAWKGSGTLQIPFSSLGVGERLAVLVLNVGGDENASASVNVSGTFSVPVPLAPYQARMWSPDNGEGSGPLLRTPTALHLWEREQEERIVRELAEGKVSRPQPDLSPAPMWAPAPLNPSFCVRQGLGTPTKYVRKTATLKRETTHALFYVDDSDLADYTAHEPGIWNTLENLWETKIYPGDVSTFGTESDVDSNNKLIIFFSKELGASQGGGILLGYYSAADVFYARDATTGCNATGNNRGSNHADMFYMNGLRNITDAGATASDVINRIYPDTLAHEFQHLINFNQHFLVHKGTAVEDTWINEGLSMVAEEIGGFGWHTTGGRDNGAAYLDRRASTSSNLSYNLRSLTVWEGDPIGNYEGSHTFFRYYADRLGSGILGQLVQTDQVGLPNLGSVVGLPFGRAFAEWSTALMFSNESFSPAVGQFDFKGANWTPLHSKVRYLNYEALNPGGKSLTLRKDGWNAFVTGNGVGGTATVTVSSSATVKPTVVVVRFSGALPAQ
ncbi:MAG TPA: hypothetical protein VK447_00070 [Myxococcaceae bacterium]|nr:hypothetical protein [Myxococcaceae bacterium]